MSLSSLFITLQLSHHNLLRIYHSVLRHISQPLSSASDLARSLVPTSAEALSDPQIDAEGRTPPLALELLLDAIIERLKARGGEEGADKAVKEGTDVSFGYCTANSFSRYSRRS